MSESSLQSQIDAAKAYEALFVPALFGQWVTTVVDAAHIRAGQRALDVACGTGVLAREIASRIGESGYVAGLDPNPGMLAVAKESAHPQSTGNRGWQNRFPIQTNPSIRS